MRKTLPLIAVDIGNARAKFGRFESDGGEGLPEPSQTLDLSVESPRFGRLATWLAEFTPERVSWWIGSVNRSAAMQLVDWLRAERPGDRVTPLTAAELSLEIALPRPETVGIDRLLDAVAANCLRRSDRPAVVVDLGTATTVDWVSAEGRFRGGAILPGMAMAARALNELTDLLPKVDMTELTDPPSAVGDSTVGAIRSGLFWGAVGSIRQLIAEMAAEAAGEPEILVTGGAAAMVAERLGPAARYVPHLTLAGIALTAQAVG